MTGILSMLAPAMVAVGLATFVVGSRSIYRSQLATRADSPAHRFRFAMPLLAAVPVGDAVRQARLVVRARDPVPAARARIEATGVPGAPVVGADGTVHGLIDLAALQLIGDQEQLVGSAMVREPILAADDGLDDALGMLADHHREWAPVVSGGGRLVGILSVRDAMTAYRTALNGNIRQVRGLRAGGLILETQIAADSQLAGRLVSEVAWPPEAVLVAVERDGALIVPRGDLRLLAMDHVSVFATPAARPRVDDLLGAPERSDVS
jgi:CIC family chloride channel protein